MLSAMPNVHRNAYLCSGVLYKIKSPIAVVIITKTILGGYMVLPYTKANTNCYSDITTKTKSCQTTLPHTQNEVFECV